MLFLSSKLPFTLNHVRKSVVIARHVLNDRAARFDPVMKIDDRRARLDEGLLAQRLTGDHCHAYESISRSRFGNLRARDLLVARLHHLVALRKVYPKLKPM